MSMKQTWQHWSKAHRQIAIQNFFDHGWPPNQDYIDLVRARDGWGVFASNGPHFEDAIFGRDSVEVAEDLLLINPKLVREIIVTLAKLQGLKIDTKSEEEPGKIHHEYRASHFNGRPVPSHSLDILHDLQNVWGGSGTDTMVYYGSHDTTLLYIRLVSNWVQHYGKDILGQTYLCRENQPHTILDSLNKAMQWLETKISADYHGLFVYHSLNPQGIANQMWKDSASAFLHVDGTLPNYTHGIASLELQGYAYDALKAAISLELGTSDDHQRWQNIATQIQTQTIKLLWMPENNFFAQAADISDDNQIRQLKTLTSDAGVLLDSQLLADLPESESQHYVESIIRTICSNEFITSVGVRCRALKHWHLPGFIDYHGTNTIWPKETLDIAKGFRKFGFIKLAQSLEECIAHSFIQAGEFYEFYYVSRDGMVWYDRETALRHFATESTGQVLPIPEPGQAWSISAADYILSLKNKPYIQDQYSDFENELVNNMPKLPAI